VFCANNLFADKTPDPHPGARTFAAKCAECHGTDGQGGDGYDDPLFGDEPVADLALLIDRTMPEGEPKACAGDEARQVAEYIYHAFYSRDARESKGLASAPRLERMRLTVSQYRNAIADLLRRFTKQPNNHKRAQQPGLWGEYFDSKKMDKTKKRKMRRTDAKIAFDFGKGAPKKGMDRKQFAVIWSGSIDIRDTGYYEFRIKSPNGVRLYLNLDHQPYNNRLRDDSASHGQRALIDGWVSSSKMREHHARVFLLGGRRYPLRLQFFKYLEEQASIELTWKPPHGVWSVIDSQHLTTANSTRTFAVDTPFPADDRSLGYERGTSVSRGWHNATSAGAVATANEVLARLEILAGVDDDTPDAVGKLKTFVLEFAAAAWRRPLRDEEVAFINKAFFRSDDSEATEQSTIPPEIATKRAILFILNSPHFLYTDLTADNESPDSYAMVSRLAFSVWDSIPDERLLREAKQPNLRKATLAKLAREMLDDPRARTKLRGFFHHWLELDERARDKDQKAYPDFDPQVMNDLRKSLELFLDEVVWSDQSDYRQLLLADHVPLNRRLRALYTNGESNEDADEGKGNDDFESTPLAEQNRAGVLTHPYLLSALAYADKTSPIHRGVFLTRNIVGRSLKAPPEAVAFKDEEFADDLTMREKVTQLTSSTNCMSCHSIINPLGFALEGYDAIGRWRTQDGEKPINATSKYMSSDGSVIEVSSARDIARFAVSDSAAQRAFVAQLFHHIVKQDPYAYGRGTLEELRKEFADDDFNIQNLWINIAARAALE